MIVEFIKDKYKCGSNRGIYATDYDNLCKDLNTVIDFDKSIYPFKWVESEDKTKYNGVRKTKEEYFKDESPSVKPGTMFIYDGQVFAIDSENRLVLAVSETGALAVERFVKDVLSGEMELMRGSLNSTAENVIVEEIEEVPENLLDNEKNLSYYKGKIWRQGTNLPKKFKTTFQSCNCILPVTLWFDNTRIFYDPEEIFEDQVEDLITEFLYWSWANK
jgi:hypothetical protein